MKYLLSLNMLFICFFAKAQSDSLKRYVVDYKLEYEVIYAEDSTKNHTVVYYINSKANNFYATVRPDNGKLKIYFTDFDGISFDRNVTPKDLEHIEQEGISQEIFFELKNPYKYQVNNYKYFAQGDSIINSYTCETYLLKSTKPKREKRKNLIHEKFYIDTSRPMLPMLIEATAYEIWKARKTLPDGLRVQKDAFRTDDTLFYSEKLLRITSVSFNISLIEDVTKAFMIDVR